MRLSLKQIALAGLLTCMGASVFAANYFYVQPKSDEMSKVAPFSVALDASPLPVGIVGQAYNAGEGFDLAPFAHVGGDPALNQALVTFAVTSGALPTGLSLSSSGLLSGTPTEAASGKSVEVTATYRNAKGAQVYTAKTILQLPNVLGNFAIATQGTGSAPYAIIPPVSLSAGAFSYSSSNLAVATISGGNVSALASGTATITATQAAAGDYAGSSTSALFTVGGPIAHTIAIQNNVAFTIPAGATNIISGFVVAASTSGTWPNTI